MITSLSPKIPIFMNVCFPTHRFINLDYRIILCIYNKIMLGLSELYSEGLHI